MLLQLPDHCLLIVLEKLDFCSHAALANVCTEMRNLIRNHTFNKMNNFTITPTNRNEIVLGLVAISRFFRLMNANNFEFRMYRNSEMDKEMPIISVDTLHSSSSPCKVFVESHFLNYLRYLVLFASRIESIEILCSMYDCHVNDPCNLTNFATWPNLKNLSIGGFNNRIMNLIVLPENSWQLKTISLYNMLITSDFLIDVASIGKQLETITFGNCKCRFISNDIITVAEGVRDRGAHARLGLKFINSNTKSDALLWAMENPDVQEYIYIQIGNRDSL